MESGRERGVGRREEKQWGGEGGGDRELLYNSVSINFSCSDKSSQFSMSLGNLPPKASVTIHLAYISQLSAQDGNFCFELPLSFAPSLKDVVISVSVKMPTAITKLESPTHSNSIKKQNEVTATEKSITFELSNKKNDDFVLLVDHVDPHIPYVHNSVDGR
jgi:hypothetical protein